MCEYSKNSWKIFALIVVLSLLLLVALARVYDNTNLILAKLGQTQAIYVSSEVQDQYETPEEFMARVQRKITQLENVLDVKELETITTTNGRAVLIVYPQKVLQSNKNEP